MTQSTRPAPEGHRDGVYSTQEFKSSRSGEKRETRGRTQKGQVSGEVNINHRSTTVVLVGDPVLWIRIQWTPRSQRFNRKGLKVK